MTALGGALWLVVLAVYFVFFTESTWLKVIGGAYIIFFFVVSIVAAFQTTEILLHLVFPGLAALLVLFGYSINSKWKNWP